MSRLRHATAPEGGSTRARTLSAGSLDQEPLSAEPFDWQPAPGHEPGELPLPDHLHLRMAATVGLQLLELLEAVVKGLGPVVRRTSQPQTFLCMIISP